jgi:hypothetical protein
MMALTQVGQVHRMAMGMQIHQSERCSNQIAQWAVLLSPGYRQVSDSRAFPIFYPEIQPGGGLGEGKGKG